MIQGWIQLQCAAVRQASTLGWVDQKLLRPSAEIQRNCWATVWRAANTPCWPTDSPTFLTLMVCTYHNVLVQSWMGKQICFVINRNGRMWKVDKSGQCKDQPCVNDQQKSSAVGCKAYTIVQHVGETWKGLFNLFCWPLPERKPFPVPPGPSTSIDTACSSSLLALENAFHAIRHGHCDAALVGGVNLLLKPNTSVQFMKLGMLSPEGTCRSFDSSGNPNLFVCTLHGCTYLHFLL